MEGSREERVMQFESNKSDLKDAGETMLTALKTPPKDIEDALKNLEGWMLFRTKLEAVESKGRLN
jgi:hypothetical protein